MHSIVASVRAASSRVPEEAAQVHFGRRRFNASKMTTLRSCRTANHVRQGPFPSRQQAPGMSGHNVFAGAFVDRSGHRREDSGWLADAITGDDACFAPVWHDKCLIDGEPPRVMFLDAGEANDIEIKHMML